VDGLLFAGFRLRQSDSQLKPPPPSISRLNPPVHQFRLYLFLNWPLMMIGILPGTYHGLGFVCNQLRALAVRSRG
jgi:hypothetical protein